MRKRIAALSLAFMCLFGIFAGKLSVSAETPAPEGQFSGDVSLIGRDNGNYIMQVTAENNGADFSGTIQLIFGKNSGPGHCAYNTEISLAAQGKKQFTVTLTDRSADITRGMCTMNFLDGKGNVVQSIPLTNVFGSIAAGIPVGVLSDDYSSLTYLDAGGVNIRSSDLNDSLALIELDRDNLTTYLNALSFLIIDHYNVSTLDPGQIQAIQEWVQDGGMLMIGTGAYAEQTLSGFDEAFLNVTLLGVSEPGEENHVSVRADRQGDYYYYRGSGIDFSQMAIAELDYGYAATYADSTYTTDAGVDNSVRTYYMYESSEHPAIYSAVGKGAVGIFYCSLGESSMQLLEDYMVRYLYEELLSQASLQGGYSSYTSMDYIGQRALGFIDNQNTHLNFTLLEILIALYVVLAGPVLYLILRKCKKSEWYWAGVPVLGLVFVLAVFLFGQSARVNETRIYSLTLQQADSDRADTQILAYHSGVKPWNIRLDDKYDAAGPGWTGYNNYYWSSSLTNVPPSNYYYLVQNDGQGLSIGIDPKSNFENGYFYANGRAERKGSITAEGIVDFGGVHKNISGTVTNDTVCDMAYMAVWFNSFAAVFSDVKAGETIDLRQAALDGRCVYQDSNPDFDDMLYSAVNLYGRYNNRNYEQDDIAALVIGMGAAMEAMPSDGDYALVAGIVTNYDRAVTGKGNETAYGCLFSYVEAEVTGNYAVY